MWENSKQIYRTFLVHWKIHTLIYWVANMFGFNQYPFQVIGIFVPQTNGIWMINGLHRSGNWYTYSWNANRDYFIIKDRLAHIDFWLRWPTKYRYDCDPQKRDTDRRLNMHELLVCMRCRLTRCIKIKKICICIGLWTSNHSLEELSGFSCFVQVYLGCENEFNFLVFVDIWYVSAVCCNG